MTNFIRLVSVVYLLLLGLPLLGGQPKQLQSTITIGGSRIDVVQEGSLALSHNDVNAWVQAAAQAVTGYYHRYPVPHVLLRVIPSSGKGVSGGQTFPREDGGFIRIHVGSEATVADLKDDWMMTHEMIHLSFPSLADKHHWIEEGIAVYIEPIARVRAGAFDANRMWYEVARDLPKGLPQAGDEGLDHTHTWGRTYWGGAMFCFLADVEIHRRTSNKKGLEDALRAILDAGGDIRHDWELEKALTIGDRATGVDVLMPQYEKMKDKPVTPDLNAIWKDLGVEMKERTARFHDDAPLAATRIAMTWGANGSKAASVH
jgi:hypothetical protein